MTNHELKNHCQRFGYQFLLYVVANNIPQPKTRKDMKSLIIRFTEESLKWTTQDLINTESKVPEE